MEIYNMNFQNSMAINLLYNVLVLSEADRLGLIEHENYVSMIKGLTDSVIKGLKSYEILK